MENPNITRNFFAAPNPKPGDADGAESADGILVSVHESFQTKDPGSDGGGAGNTHAEKTAAPEPGPEAGDAATA